jgi:hypothetical protein
MKHSILRSAMLFGIWSLAPAGLQMIPENRETEAKIEKASVQYGTQRPFSFYYPYNYQYYTPHKRYASSNACYWRYTNGSYVYYCG